MVRFLSLLSMTGAFLLISPPLRGTALAGLAKGMFYMEMFTPWSYILLAIMLSVMAVRSLASEKPR